MSTQTNAAQNRRLLPWSSVEARQGQDKDKARTRQGQGQDKDQGKHSMYLLTGCMKKEKRRAMLQEFNPSNTQTIETHGNPQNLSSLQITRLYFGQNATQKRKNPKEKEPKRERTQNLRNNQNPRDNQSPQPPITVTTDSHDPRPPITMTTISHDNQSIHKSQT